MSVERHPRIALDTVTDRGGTLEPRPAPTPAQLARGLQRDHGNQAVVHMLARNGTGTKAPKKPPGQEFKDDVAADEFLAAAMVLATCTDDQIQALLKPLTDDQLTKLDLAIIGLALMPFSLVDAGRLHRHVSFRRNAPAAPTTGDFANVTKQGAVAHTGKVTGGDVTVRTGVEYAGGTYKEGFSLGYKGSDASKTRWLQFIWREVVVDHPTKKTFRVDQEIGTSGGRYRLTTDPDKPNYNTDVGPGSTSPFYESTGTNIRTADATSMYDAPGSLLQVVKAQFDDGATKVVSRAHFKTYLVRDMKVLYEVDVDVEFVFSSATEPPRTTGVSKTGAATALDARAHERLVTQFPKYDYLP